MLQVCCWNQLIWETMHVAVTCCRTRWSCRWRCCEDTRSPTGWVSWTASSTLRSPGFFLLVPTVPSVSTLDHRSVFFIHIALALFWWCRQYHPSLLVITALCLPHSHSPGSFLMVLTGPSNSGLDQCSTSTSLIHTYTHAHTRTQACTHTYTHTRTGAPAHRHTHTHTHTHTL